MKTYHKNPRIITEAEYMNLEAWLRELGDLSGVVHDLNSDEIIGGNQRSRIFDINKCQIELVDQFPEPDRTGTVAQGFVVWEGRKYAYRQVRWTAEQCEKANIIANKAGGKWDFEMLANEFDMNSLLDWGFTEAEFGLLDIPTTGGEGGEENPYTRNIEAPIYTPTGDQPNILDLYDDTKTRALIAEIDCADIPEYEKAFLRVAAQRHTVINFKRVAEYYAHASPALQRLFENSALVIIDFSRAIELGYVRLSQEVAAQYLKDYPDEQK